MKAGGSKAKGAQFERDICVILSKWITNGSREDVFWRSAMSGGRATVGYKSGKKLSSQAGDISCIQPIGHRFIQEFVPECKFYANLDYQGLLTGRGKLLQFWNVLNEQSRRYKKHPFLICRQNRMHSYVCLDKAGLRTLGLRDLHVSLISIVYDMYLMEVSAFVKMCKPFV